MNFVSTSMNILKRHPLLSAFTLSGVALGLVYWYNRNVPENKNKNTSDEVLPKEYAVPTQEQFETASREVVESAKKDKLIKRSIDGFSVVYSKKNEDNSLSIRIKMRTTGASCISSSITVTPSTDFPNAAQGEINEHIGLMICARDSIIQSDKTEIITKEDIQNVCNLLLKSLIEKKEEIDCYLCNKKFYIRFKFDTQTKKYLFLIGSEIISVPENTPKTDLKEAINKKIKSSIDSFELEKSTDKNSYN